MRKEHEMEKEFKEFMRLSYPTVEEGSIQYKHSKVVWASACWAMFAKIKEYSVQHDNATLIGELVEGLYAEISGYISQGAG